MKVLDVSAVLRESFEMYRERAGALLPVAFWLYLLSAIVDGLTAGDFGLFWLATAFGFFVAILYQGFVVALVREAREGGRDASAWELIGRVMPVFWPLAGAAVVYGLGIAGGMLLLLVPGLVLLTFWAVVAPVIVVERRKVFDAFGRSRQLVAGVGWSVFWVIVIAFLIASVVGVALFLLAGALADGPIIRIVFNALGSTVTAPITALVAAVLYYRLLAIEASDPADPAVVADPADPAPTVPPAAP
jgi:hypothetical protein